MLIVPFHDPAAFRSELTGGKGANLSRLVQAGFRVPPGFCITTEAYARLVDEGDLRGRLSSLAGELPVDEPDKLERQTEAMRRLIVSAEMPADIAAEIERAYRSLGADAFVAVRSSGTAEDSVQASFAGQHDTYLDVRGTPAVIAAVRDCWASLWAARAVQYRRQKGLDRNPPEIAVVVQVMVRADCAGVLFTANPLTTATDETVINAIWGLGEALVQGIVTPDQWIVQSPSGTVIEQTLGDKQLQIVRDDVTGGVRRDDVPAALRSEYCLDAAAIESLWNLGVRVQAHFGGFPQDLEWAFEAGTLYLLQARPITGVEFSWDADVDLAHQQAEDADALWTRSFGDALASGVVTPLTYATRFPVFSGRNLRRIWENFGCEDLAGMRFFKYWKGTLYFNVETERRFIERLVPPPLRPMLLDFIPSALQPALVDAPFDEALFLRLLLRWHLIDNDSTPTAAPKVFERWRTRDDYAGLSYAKLRDLDDEALIAYCGNLTEIFGEWNDFMFVTIPITLRLLMSGLSWMITRWYGGTDARATFAKLVGGAVRRTDTQWENSDLAILVDRIRGSEALRRQLALHEGASFFEGLGESEEGRQFLEAYAQWIDRWGHRGHADRDYLYPRRSEDPSIDVRAFKVMMDADRSIDAAAAEHELNQRRAAVFAEVLAHVERTPGGAKRAEILKAVYTLTHEYLVMRDNERARPTDLLTFARKRGYVEIGRRLYERGQIDARRDFNFLSELELYALFRGQVQNVALLKAKIAARGRDCDRILRKEKKMPACMRRNRPVDLEPKQQSLRAGVFQGMPTSPGVITGAARVLMSHDEMARVQRRDILVTNSTDPGWNPVFGIISAVVIETGGMLSHASCLAREYGFPAVHLPNAAQLIPDGAKVTVDGDTGTVSLA